MEMIPPLLNMDGTSVHLILIDETEPGVYRGLFQHEYLPIRFHVFYNNQPPPLQDEGLCDVCGIYMCCHKEKIGELVHAEILPYL